MFNVLREALLLFGIGSRAVPAWDQENEAGNLNSGLNVLPRPTKSRHALPHPSSREGHLSTGGWNFVLLLLSRETSPPDQAHAVASSLVQRNSVPSLHIRCMMTAKRRANATIALRRLPRLAMFIAQAFSQDHFFTRVSMTWAAS